MNPATADEASYLGLKIKALTKNLTGGEIIVCPPSLFLPLILPKRRSANLAFGLQDVFYELRGPYTGEVSAEMAKSLGAKYVILGHSERRRLGETDDVIAKKVEIAIRAGLKVILCLGETKRDPEGKYLKFLEQQLESGLSRLKKSYLKDIIIAYEPVWAIGQDSTSADTPENFLHNALFLKKIMANWFGRDIAIKLPILYGGSVNSDNAEGFLTIGRAGGLLLGRASLQIEELKAIVQLVKNKPKTKK